MFAYGVYPIIVLEEGEGCYTDFTWAIKLFAMLFYVSSVRKNLNACRGHNSCFIYFMLINFLRISVRAIEVLFQAAFTFKVWRLDMRFPIHSWDNEVQDFITSISK